MIPGMIHTTPLATRRVIEKNGCVKRDAAALKGSDNDRDR